MRKSFTGVTFAPGEGMRVWHEGKAQVQDGTVPVDVSGYFAASNGRSVKTKDFTHGRHLVWDATNESTVCGLRIGLVVWHQMGRVAVHFSKARKSDCPVCRAEVRREIWRRRGES